MTRRGNRLMGILLAHALAAKNRTAK